MVPLGIRCHGLGAIALGVVGILWGDFALQWQPVAAWFPGRTILAYLFNAALVLAGACVNDLNPSKGRREVVLGAATLTTLYAGVVVFMHGPLIFQHPAQIAVWSGAAEQIALVAGGLAAYAYFTRTAPWLGTHNSTGPNLGKVAVMMLGLCLLVFGVAHFAYLDFTASMVPVWLPGGQKFWAAATGIGHLAAGVALLTGVKARLAAFCATAMFGILQHPGAPAVDIDGPARTSELGHECHQPRAHRRSLGSGHLPREHAKSTRCRRNAAGVGIARGPDTVTGEPRAASHR